MVNILLTQFRRDVVLGGIAGLLGGALLALAALDSEVDGLLGLRLSGAWWVLHLFISAIAGAVFGSVFRFQPGAYAALISNGLLYALLLWAAGPLTLAPLVEGDASTWTAVEAESAFATLIGHLLYGGFIGFSFYALATLFSRRGQESPDPGPVRPATRVVVLGGGFGGISTAQGLERISWRKSDIEITVVSQSNYLLFTPMLAEVAASALEPQHTRFYRCEVGAIDIESRSVRVLDSASAKVQTIPYDHLVLALGSVPNFFGLPGMEENAFTLKTLG